MKIIVALLLVLSLPAAAKSASCVNADPNNLLSGVSGDFEMTIDPQDPAGHVIFASNTASGAANIAVAQLDGVTGLVSAAPTIVAHNYNGLSAINGPEFVLKPTGELGAIYANTADGLHGVFRAANPASWGAFGFNDDGSAVVNFAPALLPATGPWADYPRAPISLKMLTYSAKAGADTSVPGQCEGECYGTLSGGVLTDVWGVGTANGLSVTASGQSTSREGWLYFAGADATGANALYEAQIDGNGGYVSGTLAKLANLNGAVPLNTLVAGTHPVTGDTVLFIAQPSGSGYVTTVWKQAAQGGAVSLLATVQTTNGTTHFRVEASDTELVLHYLDFNGANAGSYTIVVSANNGVLAVGPSTQISAVSHGAEFIWLPGAHQFALYDNKRAGWTLRRCWVSP